MANQWYGKALESFAGGGINWGSDTIKCLLATNGYTPSINSDQYVTDVSSGNIVARSSALSSKSATLGVLDAADITISSVTGSQCPYLIVYKDSGTDSSSPLLVKIDTGTGLPITPNGGDIAIQWDSGVNKIAALFEGLRDRLVEVAWPAEARRQVIRARLPRLLFAVRIARA